MTGVSRLYCLREENGFLYSFTGHIKAKRLFTEPGAQKNEIIQKPSVDCYDLKGELKTKMTFSRYLAKVSKGRVVIMTKYVIINPTLFKNND